MLRLRGMLAVFAQELITQHRAAQHEGAASCIHATKAQR
jgi:hypothetical protein